MAYPEKLWLARASMKQESKQFFAENQVKLLKLS